MEGVWKGGLGAQELQYRWYSTGREARDYKGVTQALIQAKKPECLDFYDAMLRIDPSQLVEMAVPLTEPVALNIWCDLVTWWRWQSHEWWATSSLHEARDLLLLLKLANLFESVTSWRAGERIAMLIHEILLEQPQLIKPLLVAIPTPWLPWLIEFTPALHISVDLIPEMLLNDKARAISLLSWLSLKYPMAKTLMLARDALRMLASESCLNAAMLQAACRLFEAFPPLVKEFYHVIVRETQSEAADQRSLGFAEIIRRIERVSSLIDKPIYRKIPTCR